MSDASNTHMLNMYMEEASSPMFLSGFFQSPPQNFHTTEKVEIDVLRDDEDIAIVVQDLTASGRENESSLYVNKGFTPPIFDEVGTVSAYNLINRQAGQNPFQDPNYGANAALESFRIFRKLESKLRRSVELMSSQVLQTGVLTLTDAAGNTLYSLDFQPKTTHITDVNQAAYSTTWATDGTAGVPLADLDVLAQVVRRDGKRNPKELIFGSSAMQRFLANPDVKAQLDNRGFNVGRVAPQSRGQGASFRGTIWIGHYEFNMWMYDAFYRDPVTGNHVDYINTNKVVMLSEGARLDLSFGAIPMLVAPEQRALSFLPPRMSSSDRGLDMTVNAWVTPDNKHLKVSAGTRPLTIPTAIDTFACLNVAP